MKRIIIRAIRTKLFSNFSWLFAGTVVKIIMRLTASLYLARMLGPLGLGQLSFAQAVLAYFILFIDCGLEASGTREIAMASKKGSNSGQNIYNSTGSHYCFHDDPANFCTIFHYLNNNKKYINLV